MKRTLPILLAAAVLLTLLFIVRRPAPEFTAPVSSAASVLPDRLNPVRATITPEPYGPEQAALEDAMRTALATQAAKSQTLSATGMAPITSARNPDHLVPHQEPLTVAQQAALGKLRWKTRGKHVDIRTGEKTSAIRLLHGRSLEPAAVSPEVTASNFLAKNSDLLRLNPTSGETVLRTVEKDELGYTQLRYTTAYAGLEVWPSSFTVQLDPSGDVGLLTGAYAPTPEGLSIEPAIAAAAARRTALKAAEASPLVPHPAAELKIYAPTSESEAKLAYYFDLHTAFDTHWDVFIDAQSGELLHKHNCVCTANVRGSGVDSNGQTRPLDLWQHTDGGFYMVDTTKRMFQPDLGSIPDRPVGAIKVFATQDAEVVQGKLMNFRYATAASGSPTSGFSPSLVSASANVSIVYDYFLERFNRNSYDGKGGNILVYDGLENYNNASFAHEVGSMFIGDAQNFAGSLDVIAHEISHGIIGTSADLVYQDQSGALNESYADIFGESIETFGSGSTPDWIVGSQLSDSQFQRSFSDPSTLTGGLGRPYPERMSEYEITESDAGGVHTNSSIHNYAFYQLVAGLPSPISLNEGLDIFYRALTTKLNKNSGFVDSRLACVISAREIFGAGSVQEQRVGQAFDFVEVFDQNSTPDETPIPTVSANDATLFTFASGFSHFLGRRDTTFNDPSAGVFLGNNGIQTPAAPGLKPSVRGDGLSGIFVTPNFDAAIVDTMNGASVPVGLAGRVQSVGISADGNVYALVLGDVFTPAKQIFVFNIAEDSSKLFTAAQPIQDDDGNGLEDSIVRVETLDLSPNGAVVFYDAVTRIRLDENEFIDNWATYGIDVGREQIFSLFPPIPGVNLGNPAIGQTRSNLLTFDVQDESTGVYSIFAADIASGELNQVMTLGSNAGNIAPGWPGYNGDDTALVFTDYFINNFGNLESLLVTLPLAADGITPTGQASEWLIGSGAQLGTIYRRGDWGGLPEVSATATNPNASENPGNPGRFQLSRTGSTARPLGVTFTVTGSAQNGNDFEPFPFTATIPAGSSTVDLTLFVTDDTIAEGDETATLTILDRVDYQCVGAPALVMIEDNDMDTGYDAWATANNATGGPGGNSDRDSWTNLMEYALGLDPQVADGKDAIRASVQGGRLIVDVTRASKRPGLTYTVEFGTALSSWSAAGSNVLTDTPTALRTQGTATSRFARLRVTQ